VKFDPLGMLKFYCQRYNVNVTGLIYNSSHWGNKYNFLVQPFHERELVRDFGGKGRIKSLRIFSKSSTINRFDVLLPTTI